jgi:hypothetical protein
LYTFVLRVPWIPEPSRRFNLLFTVEGSGIQGILRAEIATIFGPNVVAISARNTKVSVQNLSTLQGYIFRILQHFATKLCNFTHFSMLFLAVVIYSHLLA